MRASIPPSSILENRPLPLVHYRWFASLLKEGGLEVQIDESLVAVNKIAFQFMLDGELCILDYSDWITMPPIHWKFKHWFKERFITGHDIRPQIHPFSSPSFEDWNEFKVLRETLKYDASGDMIIHKQKIAQPLNNEMRNQLYRRSMARNMLLEVYGNRVDTRWDQQSVFFTKCAESLVVVHIPGIWEHTLDRAQLQLMGLGVCIISPDIMVGSCGVRPQPDLHYIRIRDDYSDLIQKVRWCEAHRSQCKSIGEEASKWFDEYALPTKVVLNMVSRL